MKVWIVIVGLLAAAGQVGAQLVDNGGFDSSVDGWEPFPFGTVVWDPLDVAGSPGSGSALITNQADSPGDASGPYQCVTGIFGGQEYLAKASVLLPGGQAESGWTRMLVRWYADACFGTQLGTTITPNADTPDVWSTTEQFVEAPTGTQVAAIRLDVWKVEAGGELSAHFDNVVLDAVLFRDDLESGTLDAWSGVMP
jgi:hypothetical protein